MRVWLLMALGLGVAGATPPARAESPSEVPVLRHDPFARPDLGAGASPRPGAGEGVAELRATLVAGEGSLANLGGVLLRVGEEAYGYRLLEVHPFEALFERDGETVLLELPRTSAEREPEP